jgi:hypothetical protein
LLWIRDMSWTEFAAYVSVAGVIFSGFVAAYWHCGD